jgi:D-glucuronyl C5-epimerase C-terminus
MLGGSMGRKLPSLTVLAAALGVAAFAAGPARAAEVIVVDGGRAARVEDPLAPSHAQAEPAVPAVGRARAARSQGGPRSVYRALRRQLRAGRISRSRYRAYVKTFRRARVVRRRLTGARGRQLGYGIQTVERIALRGRLIPSRMPEVFLILRRNTQYWPSRPYPASRDWVRFRGSELLFQYFPGRGLQLHPLGTFKRANLMHGNCVRRPGTGQPRCDVITGRPGRPGRCERQRLRRLLDEMSRLAVQRGRRFIAWEYMFDFGGGSPPWISAMAQAEAIKAYARAGRLLDRPEYFRTAARSLGAYQTRWPIGVRAQGPLGGTYYLQYSFAPRLRIFNAFFAAVMGLHDYARLTGDERARKLFRRAEPEARREVRYSDLGDWSLYNWRGHASDRSYHELLREVLQGLGIRLGGIYCRYAIRYRHYQIDPPRLRFLGPSTAVDDRLTRLRFSLSKLSVVELRVFKGGRLAYRRLATFRRGGRFFLWRPRSPGSYTVRLGAKELRTGRGLKGSSSGSIEVAPGA